MNKRVYERDIAVVYYLSRDFTEDDGGAFVDLNDGGKFREKILKLRILYFFANVLSVDDKPKPIVPKFNTLVSFVIPREHAVSPVVTDKVRYSLFGWFLKPVEAQEEEVDDGGAEEEKEEESD